MRPSSLASALLQWFAWLNGDTAYRAHVEHLRAHHPELATPSRADFYRGETERRWNGIRRCC
jgi:uncharacterized short protein YbdD (DUF466 family)